MIDGFSKPKLSKSRKFQNLIMTPVFITIIGQQETISKLLQLSFLVIRFFRNSVSNFRDREIAAAFLQQRYTFSFLIANSFRENRLNMVKKRTKFSFQCLLCDLHGTMRSMYSGRNFRTLILSLSIFLHTHTHKIFVFSAIGSKELPLFQLLLTRIDFIFLSFFFFLAFVFVEIAKCQVLEWARKL